MIKQKIVILARRSLTTNLLFWHLSDKYDVVKVFIEEKEDRLTFLKRRLKKLKLVDVVGQVLFMLLAYKIILYFSRPRLKELLNEFSLEDKPIPKDKISNVRSINDEKVFEDILVVNPDFIVVNGTRIITKKNLSRINLKIINLHLGITPMYRGSHGGYWAVRNNDINNFGATFHYIDSGIDTGRIIFQKKATIKNSDNISTYPLVLFLNALDNFNEVLTSLNYDNVKLKDVEIVTSHIYQNPTIWDYYWHRIFNGSK